MTSYGSRGTKGCIPDTEEKEQRADHQPDTPIPLHWGYMNTAGHILFLAFMGGTKSAVSAFKSRQRLIGRLTKIDYASEFKASESAPECQPATDVLVVFCGFMWYSVRKTQ